MNKIPTRNYVIEIPLDWTAAQADAVFEFLSIIETAVFDAYDKEISEIAQHQDLAARIDELNPNEEKDPSDADIPF
jgi:hypothetical protein